MDDASSPAGADSGAGRSRARARQRATRVRRPSVIGILGEILITLGVVTLLFVAWQLWIGDVIYGAERSAQADEQSQIWQEEYEHQIRSTPQATEPPEPADVEPVVRPEPADAEIFATMYIPRFGADYHVNMAGGVTRANTLDPIGIGHYPGTQMPGEEGNFAVAAHRTTWGKPFNRIAELHVGDAIVIETPDGWYTYRFRTLAYVRPDAVEVLLPVPQATEVAANDRYLTMTSCSPMYSLAERIVAFSVFDSFTPRSAGAPVSLTGGVA
ncbi:class E sortase [Microbacterium sp. NPDC019599]|uniref:class E sortase n=1 Tax=Microbacterium sp. NPDC019599 TaxID=3154690 RepID=UPI0033C89141